MFHLSYDLYLHHDDLSAAFRNGKRSELKISKDECDCFRSFHCRRFGFNVNDSDLFGKFRNGIESRRTVNIRKRRSLLLSRTVIMTKRQMVFVVSLSEWLTTQTFSSFIHEPHKFIFFQEFREFFALLISRKIFKNLIEEKREFDRKTLTSFSRAQLSVDDPR